MAKKKVLVFATGWGESIIGSYVSGAEKGFKDESVDIYLFMCYGSIYDRPEFLRGEMNIFNLPNLKDFSGAMLLGNSMDVEGVFDTLNAKCAEAGIPIVTTGRRSDGAYFVGVNNDAGMRDLCEHLVTVHGCKDFFYFGGAPESPDSKQREKVLRDVLAEHNIEFDDSKVEYTNWSPERSAEYLEELVNKGAKIPEVFVCANDILAMAVIERALELGIKVPEEVKVTGFDNLNFANVFEPSVCTVDPDFSGVGEMSAKILTKLINGERVEKEAFVPSKFIASESCGCKIPSSFLKLRKQAGRNVFVNHMRDSNFERMLISFERELLSCETFDELKSHVCDLIVRDHTYEGNSVHIVLDSSFRRFSENPEASLRVDGYDKTMDVIASYCNGNVFSQDDFEVRNIVPQFPDDDKNHSYIVLPIHEETHTMGYIVFGDDISKVSNSNRLYTYVNRMNLLFSKFRQGLIVQRLVKTLEILNATDPLTKVKNRGAFENKLKEFDDLIEQGKCPDFAVAVFDVNNLKAVNDLMGHASGDDYLVNCCRMICDFFKKSPVYRIGGDEFSAILTGRELENAEESLTKMRRHIDELKKSDLQIDKKLSVASGVSKYVSFFDNCFNDVFSRADTLMYQNKATMKGERNIR